MDPTVNTLKNKLASQRQTFGDFHINTLGTMVDLAWTVWGKGSYAEAELLFREAIEGYRRTLGDEHPATLGPLYHLVNLFNAEGKGGDAETLRTLVKRIS